MVHHKIDSTKFSKEAAAIEFKAVSKVYKLPKGGTFEGLKPLSLTIPKGEFFGLLGHNGAGKTTAINLLAGVNQLTSGDIFIHGQSVVENPELTKRTIGVVQQELIVDSFFALPTMLNIQSKLYGVAPDKEWIEFILEKLQLAEHRKKTTRELSGGMKRRMMIARALVHKPSVLVLDEPTAGVDVQLRLSMWEFIRELHNTGMTIILTTHYIEEAENFCSRIGIMKNGHLVALKSNQDLLSLGGKPKFSFVVKFFSQNSFDSLRQEIQNLFSINDILVEPVNEMYRMNGVQKLKISMPISYEDLNFFIQYIEKMKQIASLKNFTIESFYTEQPHLEEVFLKINDGQIITESS